MLDQARIDEFARCTGDHQWIHVDEGRAARDTPFGGTIAHGYLTLSLVAPSTFAILVDNVTVSQALNYGLDKVRFVAPVRAGKRVRNRIRLTDLVHKGDGRFLATTENTIEIEDEAKPALVATALALLVE
jgi:acyl dehydratase